MQSRLKQYVDDVSINIFVKVSTNRTALAIGGGLALVSGNSQASGKISGMTGGWTTELGAGTKFGLLLLAAAGIVLGTYSSISWVIAKKNQETPKWQGYGLLGGAAAVIGPVLVLAFAGSIGNGGGNATGTFNQLGISG